MPKSYAVIAGRELPEAIGTPIDALQEHYFALNNRDMAAMKRNWLASDEVSMRGPVGGINRGWDAVAAAYGHLFGAAMQVHVELHDFSIHEDGGVFWAVGLERGWFKAGDARFELAIRATRIFRRVDGRWRQVHHHGSIEMPELLARYQTALLRS